MIKIILKFLKSLMSISTTPDTVKNSTIGSDEQPGVITTISGTDVRFLAGFFPASTVNGNPAAAFLGAKLSKPGYDARTATDDQLIWSSAFNNFKILKTGSLTTGALSGNVATDSFGQSVQTTTVTYASLGLANIFPYPIVLAFAGGAQALPQYELGAIGDNTKGIKNVNITNLYVNAYTDRFEVTESMQVWNYGGLGTYAITGGSTPITWYLIKETAGS